ncbi:MAG: glycosyltransferase [Paludibacteraceae bacterium]|nr:glycosyltransferase [Paludibacteraceae bacterium]
MNTQVKLSFVIPFYNGGKYIRECIESLYLQDIPKNDYEVLIVDDCSSNVDDISLIQALEAFYPTLHIIHN